MPILSLLLKNLFSEEGRDLVEVMKCSEAMTVLKKSTRLNAALALYRLHIKTPKAQLEDLQELKAVNLARELASGEGLNTILGFQNLEEDGEELGQAVYEFLSRNPHADAKQIQAARILRDMLDKDIYSKYKAALDKYRRC